MMENAAQAQQKQRQLQGAPRLSFGFGFTRDPAASTAVNVDRREDTFGEEAMAHGALSDPTLSCSPLLEGGDPSKVIMWCAIALGALVLGAPVQKVGLDRATAAATQHRPRGIGDKYMVALLTYT